jgi:hypothetical protein
MPSVKELYKKLSDVKIDANSVNLNTDTLESLLSTTQTDVALIKADMANGVSVNGDVNANIIPSQVSDGIQNYTDNIGQIPVFANLDPYQIGQGIERYIEDYGNNIPVNEANSATINSSVSSISSAIGAQTDSVATTDTNNWTVIAFIKRGMQNWTSLLGRIPALVSGRIPVDGSGVTQPVSGTVTVNDAQGTTVTKSSFTSTTASTSLVASSANRRMLTVFNEGAGTLYVSAGSTCTTTAYQVRLSSGDYWECPSSQASLAHTAVFASTGSARVTEIV